MKYIILSTLSNEGWKIAAISMSTNAYGRWQTVNIYKLHKLKMRKRGHNKYLFLPNKILQGLQLHILV
jgi:hypothetical protein